MPAGIFLVTAALTAIAGVALSRLADAVAKRSGLGGLIVGLILVALITSLSEVAAAISAARLAVPDIAAGDLFGASLMNMGILGFVDLMIHRRRRLLAEVTLDHVLTGGLSIVLVGVASEVPRPRGRGARGRVPQGALGDCGSALPHAARLRCGRHRRRARRGLRGGGLGIRDHEPLAPGGRRQDRPRLKAANRETSPGWR